MNHLSAADWAVILLYLLAIIALGVGFGKDQRTTRDYFLGSSFRFTAGALIGQRKASGNGVATNGTITINGTTYPAAGESVAAEARFPSFAPYLGIGFGHAQVSKGLSFYFDAGVAIGKADAKITASPGLVAAAGQSNIDAEQRNLQDSVDALKFFPTVKFGLGYNF